MLLPDHVIRHYISTSPIVHNLELSSSFSSTSQIQPCSLDLTIGSIYLPEKDGGADGGYRNPILDDYLLEPGNTAVVETKEHLDMPLELASICFPISSSAMKGLLILNPGHIDPGYKGALKFTVINMGQGSFQLRSGDKIATLLFMELKSAASRGYVSPHSTKLKHILNKFLSSNFLNIEKRADAIAKKHLGLTLTFAVLAPIFVAVITFFYTFTSIVVPLNITIADLKVQIGELRTDLSNDKRDHKEDISRINSKLNSQEYK